MTTGLSHQPLVSICIPTYNGEAFLEATLGCVLNQTYPNIEVIVSDDQSTDRTLEIVEKTFENAPFPVHIYPHEPHGIGANWNYAVQQANGEYIKFLFQDDLMEPHCIERMMGLALQDSRVGLVYCTRSFLFDKDRSAYKKWLDHAEFLHRKWKNIQEVEGIRAGKDYLKDPAFYPSENKIGEPVAVLLKKSCFEKVGYFHTELKQTLDFEYWYRVMKNFHVGFVDENLVTFRLHSQQATQVNIHQQVDESRLLARIYFKELFWHLSAGCKWRLLKDVSGWSALMKKVRKWLRKPYRWLFPRK